MRLAALLLCVLPAFSAADPSVSFADLPDGSVSVTMVGLSASDRAQLEQWAAASDQLGEAKALGVRLYEALFGRDEVAQRPIRVGGPTTVHRPGLVQRALDEVERAALEAQARQLAPKVHEAIQNKSLNLSVAPSLGVTVAPAEKPH